jgi:tetratricopeptide (TPR) repeat protein
MWLFNKRKQEKVRGAIAYYGLTDWWLSTFTEKERKYIERKFRPMGSGPDSLTKGHVEHTGKTSGVLLHQTASSFTDAKDFDIARRLLEKAEQECLAQDDTVGLHYTYSWMSKIYFDMRVEVPGALELTIDACEKSIALATKAATALRKAGRGGLPSHGGYRSLALIREEQGDYQEAIRLYKAAKKQGWSGDWNEQIARCQQQLREQGE